MRKTIEKLESKLDEVDWNLNDVINSLVKLEEDAENTTLNELKLGLELVIHDLRETKKILSAEVKDE